MERVPFNFSTLKGVSYKLTSLKLLPLLNINCVLCLFCVFEVSEGAACMQKRFEKERKKLIEKNGDTKLKLQFRYTDA